MKILDIFRTSSGSHLTDYLVSNEAKVASQKFDDDELYVLKKTWIDLAERSDKKGIDKEVFLQYFPLNGLLGERLFVQFDRRNCGIISFDDFIIGLSIVCRGTEDEKIHFLFNMYDVGHDNRISKQELTTLLNHIPHEIFHPNGHHHSPTNSVQNFNVANNSTNIPNSLPPPALLNPPSLPPTPHSTTHFPSSLIKSNSINSINNFGIASSNLESDSDKGSVYGDSYSYTSEFEEIDSYTNQDVIDKAFAECDLSHEGRLTYEEFKMWVQKNPCVLEYIENILPYDNIRDKKKLPHTLSKKDSLPHIKRMVSKGKNFKDSDENFYKKRNSITGQMSPCPASPQVNTYNFPATISRNGSFSSTNTPINSTNGKEKFFGEFSDSEDQARFYLSQAMDTTQNSDLKENISKILEQFSPNINVKRENTNEMLYKKMVKIEGTLWKKGKSFFHMLSRRYYLLIGKCLYYFLNSTDIRPKGVIFLSGCIIEKIKDDDMVLRGYYGFEILQQDIYSGRNEKESEHHHHHEKRILYCRSAEELDQWVTTLQHAAQVIPIEDDYVIGKELGRGRFSIVYECVHKATGRHSAVKVINKSAITYEEKVLLRTEMAVLKLVDHPNIIKLEGIYESKKYIYIVMEMLKGGELFERIVGRPRFSEKEAAKLLRPLLESVAYIHDLGIVHRDLKPENILCGDELDDIKIADFGLSKMILPKEKMDAACGTLSYVAPEVLTMQGYGKEADLWSVGVIMFLILCGKLPFDGENHNEIIRSTIQGDIKVNASIWNKLSEDARNLITLLLNKNPKDRITAREALRHPFFINNYCGSRRPTHNHGNVPYNQLNSDNLYFHHQNQLISNIHGTIGQSSGQSLSSFHCSTVSSLSNSLPQSSVVASSNPPSLINPDSSSFNPDNFQDPKDFCSPISPLTNYSTASSPQGEKDVTHEDDSLNKKDETQEESKVEQSEDLTPSSFNDSNQIESTKSYDLSVSPYSYEATSTITNISDVTVIEGKLKE